MKENHKRLISVLVSALVIITVFAGCAGSQVDTGANNPTAPVAPEQSTGKSDEPDAQEVAPATKKTTLTIAAGREPATLHPIDENYLMTAVMCYQITNKLFNLDAKLNAVPELVENYEMTSDTEYLMTLHKGVLFHNGMELKAEDVKATIEYAQSIARAKAFVIDIADVEVIDNYTFKITTKQPTSQLLHNLTNPQVSILPKELIDAGHDFNAEPIGTGPYKFVSYAKGDKLVLEKFSDYFDKQHPPTMDTVTWRFIPEGSARTIALETGDVDFIFDVASIDIPSLQNNPKVEVLVTESVQLTALTLNHKVAPFDNIKVRQAIASAIDRESVAQVATNGLAMVAISHAPIGMEGYTDKGALNYNVEKAKVFMAESGVDPSTIKLEIIANNDALKKAAEVIQANLLEIGINAQVVTMDFAANMDALDSGVYTGSLGSYAQRTLPQFLRFLYSETGTGGKRLGYRNPEFEALLDEIYGTLDEAKRVELTENAVRMLNEDAAYVPLFQESYVKAFDANLTGVNVDALGSTYYHYISWK